MNQFSENDIREIVSRVLTRVETPCQSGESAWQELPVEVSARHVHLDRAQMEILFGTDYKLTPKRALSQPGQFLCEERVKLVTACGQIDNVAVLGPVRKATQVELSLTDARTLGLKVPIRLSGDLRDAADVVIVGPKGAVNATGAAIAAKAHVHMTPEDAVRYGVQDGQRVRLHLDSDRSVTIHDVVVRVDSKFALAAHIDHDEANAAGGIRKGILQIGKEIQEKPCGQQCGAVDEATGERKMYIEPVDGVKSNERNLITEAIALKMVKSGKEIRISPKTIITPAARDVFIHAGAVLKQD